MSAPAELGTLEAAIDQVYERLELRMSPLGTRFALLSDAIRRAGSGGKRFRPMLVIRSFGALGGRPEDCPALFPVAAAFELLHTAFLMHDDVIDGDTERRGVPNVSGEFRDRAGRHGADPAGAASLGDAAGILAGDLVLLEAQRLLATADAPAATRERLIDLFDRAVLVSAAGELADVEHAVLDRAPGLEATLTTAHDKTAVYSFSAPLRAGAALAGSDAAVDHALERVGAWLGLAFQLVDDLIGAFGSRAQAGREVGADLAAARATPLVAVARDTGDWPVVSDALAVAHTGPIAVRAAQRALDDSGARTHLQAMIHDNLLLARSEPDLPAALASLVDELATHVEERIP